MATVKKAKTFSEDVWAQIYRTFGEHCRRSGNIDAAVSNFKKSLKLKENGFSAVSKLARIDCERGEAKNALGHYDILEKYPQYERNFECSLQQCACHYDANNFEQCMLEISNKSKNFGGFKKRQFDLMFYVANTSMDDTIKNAENILYNKRKLIQEVQDLERRRIERKNFKSTWRARKERNECDVVSFEEFQEEEIDPKEQRRVEMTHRKLAQIYLNRGWQDYEALKRLMNDKTIIESTQNVEDNKMIRDTVEECLDKTSNFIKMLHTRCPLYTYKQKMFCYEKRLKEQRKITVFRIQLKNRNEMFVHIKMLNEYRRQGNLTKLINFAEKILKDFYQPTPDKLMPRKQEFITEICNIIGLAHVDKLKIINDSSQVDGTQLRRIFNIPVTNKDKTPAKYILGDQSTYRHPAEEDIKFLRQKKKLERIERRLRINQSSIEKCHFYHETAKLNVEFHRYDEVRTFARKVVEESVTLKNLLWNFLGTYMLCKSAIMQTNYKKAIEAMKTAKMLAVSFKSLEMEQFADSAIKVMEKVWRL